MAHNSQRYRKFYLENKCNIQARNEDYYKINKISINKRAKERYREQKQNTQRSMMIGENIVGPN